MDELDLTTAESNATYAEIKDYVLKEHERDEIEHEIERTMSMIFFSDDPTEERTDREIIESFAKRK